MNIREKDTHLIPWKAYLIITAETLLAFYLATFCMAMYFTHQGSSWVVPSFFLIILYLFVIFVCAKRIKEKLPIAAIMIVIPIAPLLALAIVISLIPLIQKLQ